MSGKLKNRMFIRDTSFYMPVIGISIWASKSMLEEGGPVPDAPYLDILELGVNNSAARGGWVDLAQVSAITGIDDQLKLMQKFHLWAVRVGEDNGIPVILNNDTQQSFLYPEYLTRVEFCVREGVNIMPVDFNSTKVHVRVSFAQSIVHAVHHGAINSDIRWVMDIDRKKQEYVVLLDANGEILEVNMKHCQLK